MSIVVFLIEVVVDVVLVIDKDGVICDFVFGNDEFVKEGYCKWIG